MQAVDGGQGTGAEARLSTPYLEADGVNQRVLLNRRIEILNSDTSRGVANFQDQSGVDPAAATDGELYIRSDGHLPRLFDGSVWDRFHMQKHVLTVPTSLSTVGNFPGLIIPGNALTLGSVVKIRGSMEMVGDAGGGGITAQVRIGGIVVAAGGIFGTASIGDFLMWDISVVFRTVGVTGLWKTCGYEADSVESPTLLLQNTDYADTGTINTTGDIVVEQRVNVISAGDVWSQGFFTVDFT
ncbi:MAG TPA: hypothetical protein ENH89_18715 [Aurantimonas coralicida]|uniref:Uncharacterized protein n=2 Tax=root TaxID=1 RepID=A0A9C9TIA0_9HYPH|nr:hypothetical protein [Aurantimonas coralicida]